MRRQLSPRAAAYFSTRRTIPSSNLTGSKRLIRSTLIVTLSVCSSSFRNAASAASSARRHVSSGFRMSMVNTARDGMTFVAFGVKAMQPVVATVRLPGRQQRSRMNAMTFAAATPASRR